MNAEEWLNTLQDAYTKIYEGQETINNVSNEISWEGYYFTYTEAGVYLIKEDTLAMALVTKELLIELINSVTVEDFEKYFNKHIIQVNS